MDLRDMAEGFRNRAEDMRARIEEVDEEHGYFTANGYDLGLEYAARSLEKYAEEAEQELELMQDMADLGMTAAREWGEAMLDMLDDIQKVVKMGGSSAGSGYVMGHLIDSKIEVWRDRINDAK